MIWLHWKAGLLEAGLLVVYVSAARVVTAAESSREVRLQETDQKMFPRRAEARGD